MQGWQFRKVAAVDRGDDHGFDARDGARDGRHGLSPGGAARTGAQANTIVGGLQPIERDADDADAGIDGQVETLLVEQSSIGDEGGAQSDFGEVSTQVVPIGTQQRLTPGDVNVTAAELLQLPGDAADPVGRELTWGGLAALVLAVNAAQVAATGDLPDAGERLANDAVEWVPVQTKRTP